MSSCKTPSRAWYAVTYGSPNPRYIRPLVRINATVEDMPAGYKLDPCLLPDTIMKLDTCAQTLQVNNAMISYADMFPCTKLPMGSETPVSPPAEGYYPFYLKLLTPDTANLYAHTGSDWVKIVP